MLTNLVKLRKQTFQLLGATLVAATAIGTLALTAEAKRSPRFNDASLYGQYAVQSIGDDHVSVGLGTVNYDGRGNATRRILVNAPDGDERQFLLFESVGWYAVSSDGTGTATFENVITPEDMESTTSTTTFDFVITETKGVSPRSRGAKLAQEIYSAQRESGVTVSLVTNVQTRQ